MRGGEPEDPRETDQWEAEKNEKNYPPRPEGESQWEPGISFNPHWANTIRTEVYADRVTELFGFRLTCDEVEEFSVDSEAVYSTRGDATSAAGDAAIAAVMYQGACLG